MCSLIRPVCMVLQSLSGRNKEHCLIFLNFFNVNPCTTFYWMSCTVSVIGCHKHIGMDVSVMYRTKLLFKHQKLILPRAFNVDYIFIFTGNH